MPGGSYIHNTQKEQPEKWVEIIHAAHVMKGQKIAVVPTVRNRHDPGLILVELADGKREYMPADWTDLEGRWEYPSGVRMTVEGLVHLRNYVDDLIQELEGGRLASDGGNMADKKGDSHADPKPSDLAETQSDPAHARDCRTGANVAAAMDEDRGGTR
jgi:hypothetical protein